MEPWQAISLRITRTSFPDFIIRGQGHRLEWDYSGRSNWNTWGSKIKVKKAATWTPAGKAQVRTRATSSIRKLWGTQTRRVSQCIKESLNSHLIQRETYSLTCDTARISDVIITQRESLSSQVKTSLFLLSLPSHAGAKRSRCLLVSLPGLYVWQVTRRVPNILFSIFL